MLATYDYYLLERIRFVLPGSLVVKGQSAGPWAWA